MVERTILESSSDFIDIESEPGASVFIVPNEQDNTEEYDKVLNYHNNERLNSSVTIDSLSLVSSKKEYLPARRQGRIGLIRSLDQTWREPQFTSIGNQLNLDVQDLARKNKEREKKLKLIKEENLSSNDPEEVLKNFMKSSERNRKRLDTDLYPLRNLTLPKL